MGSSRWLACWASDTRFKVKNGLVSFIVDLSKKTCSCREMGHLWHSMLPCNFMHFLQQRSS